MTEAVTEDALLGGRIRIRQPATGYRAAIDPVLLAAAVPAGAGELVLDVGCGVGTASLCLAARVPGCRVFGVDVARTYVRLATGNVTLNGMDGRVDVMIGDLTQPPPRLAAGTFDHVMANPPHLDPRRADPPPEPDKATAAVERTGNLAEWVTFCAKMARPRGTVTFIHRADRLDDLLAHVGRNAGAIVVFPLWPDGAGERPAKRVIVQAQKGAATPLRLSPGLALHARGGAYAERADAVLRDGAALTL